MSQPARFSRLARAPGPWRVMEHRRAWLPLRAMIAGKPGPTAFPLACTNASVLGIGDTADRRPWWSSNCRTVPRSLPEDRTGFRVDGGSVRRVDRLVPATVAAAIRAEAAHPALRRRRRGDPRLGEIGRIRSSTLAPRPSLRVGVADGQWLHVASSAGLTFWTGSRPGGGSLLDGVAGNASAAATICQAVVRRCKALRPCAISATPITFEPLQALIEI